MAKQKKVSILVTNIPFDTKALFKAWCAKRGLNMSRVIEEMMKEKIKNDFH